MVPDPPLVCCRGTFTAEERTDALALTRRLIPPGTVPQDSENGLTFHLAAPLADIARWIEYERICCPFLSFQLAISSSGEIALTLSGPDGTKQILRAELGL